MKKAEIRTGRDYDKVMARIEKLLEKSTKTGGLDKLDEKEVDELEELSIMAEEYEDSIPIMPIKSPDTLSGMIKFKMYEKNIRQRQLADLLEVGESYVSKLMNGRQPLNWNLAKKLHDKLNIDANFLMKVG